MKYGNELVGEQKRIQLYFKTNSYNVRFVDCGFVVRDSYYTRVVYQLGNCLTISMEEAAGMRFVS